MFTFDSKTTVVFGQDTVGELGVQVTKLDAQKALLVTDKGIIRAGLLEKVNRSLAAAGSMSRSLMRLIPIQRTR